MIEKMLLRDEKIIGYPNINEIIVQTINGNQTQICTLAALRETLLPELMRGS